MLIDWFTVSAQVINFLILVWLLKRFLYKPILKAIDARETRIATALADADTKRTEAEKERETFQEKNEEFDRQRAEMLDKLRDEARTEHQRLLEAARQDSDALRAKSQDALKRELAALDDEISRRTREEVFAIARKTLTELAGVTLEQRMTEVFIERLRDFDDEARKGMGDAVATSTDPAVVRSAFDLSPEQQDAIQHALTDAFSAGIHIRFETSPELVSGIEFSTNGKKVAWSVADCLTSLGRDVGELLQKQAVPHVKADAEDGAKPNPETDATAADQTK